MANNYTSFPHTFPANYWMSDQQKERNRELRNDGKIIDWLESDQLGVVHPLPPALAMALPFMIRDLIAQGGPSDTDHEWLSSWRGLSEHGDKLLYKGEKTGESAKLFAELVRAVAILSFAPGGITIFDQHYEAYQREQELEDARKNEGFDER